MKKTKKILALALAAAMTLAPTAICSADAVTSSPATGGSVSDGNFEGWIEKEVFSVTLPTQSDNAFDFIVDPQNLISDSNNAASANHANVTTEGAVGVYFKQGSGYAASSDALTVENQSSMDVNVSVDAKLTITSGDSVNLVTAGAVTSDIATSSSALDLSISVNQVTTNAVEYISNETNTASLTTTMAAIDADNFEITYNGGYKYAMKQGTTDKTVAKFYLTGSCNTAADWSTVKDMSTKLELVWTVEKGAANTITGTYSKATGGAFSTPLNGFVPTTVTVTDKPGATGLSVALNTTSHYTVKADTFYLKTSWVSGLANGDWVITLSDGSTVKTLKLTVTD